MAFLAAKRRFICQKIDDIDNDDSNAFQNAFFAKALALEETDPMVEILEFVFTIIQSLNFRVHMRGWFEVFYGKQISVHVNLLDDRV